MRSVIVAAAILVLPTTSFAQDGRAYVSAAGGFASTVDGTSGDMVGEAGVRVARNFYVFGDLGRFHNLAPSLFQPTADAASADFAASGLMLTGSSVVPAWYTTGGIKYNLPIRSARFTPYVFTSAGVARLTPANHFTYTSGTLAGASPAVGDDVTSQLVSLGEFTQPAASSAFMWSGGGGVEVPVAGRVAVDVGYRASRIAADTPVTAQSVTFGLGYRF